MANARKLTHFNASGQATMVDIGDKGMTRREAIARGRISMQDETIELLSHNALPKGNAIETARLAGIMAAKKTDALIPLCHQLRLEYVDVQIIQERTHLTIEAIVRCRGKTGAEMEALTAVSVTALTLYDMCKAVDKTMVISEVKLIKKTGGKSRKYIRPGESI